MPSTPEVRDLVSAVQTAGTAEDLLRATRALAAAGTAEDPVDPQAISCLVTVLGFNNPGAAVAAVEGLVRLGPVAVEPLLRQLDPRNYGARAWAVRALAGIGDVRGLDVLEEALATDVGPSVRRAAARGLGGLQLAGLAATQREVVFERALAALEAGRSDGEWVVRYAVAVGLETLALANHPDRPRTERILQGLGSLAETPAESVEVVRLRARVATSRLTMDRP
jgi:phycocyanobilin lyase beta subunit